MTQNRLLRFRISPHSFKKCSVLWKTCTACGETDQNLNKIHKVALREPMPPVMLTPTCLVFEVFVEKFDFAHQMNQNHSLRHQQQCPHSSSFPFTCITHQEVSLACDWLECLKTLPEGNHSVLSWSFCQPIMVKCDSILELQHPSCPPSRGVAPCQVL